MRYILIIMACVVLFAGGCGVRTGQDESVVPALTPPPTEQEEMAEAGENPGSLFSPGSAEYLFNDNRARRVGDIVIVNIVERSSASSTADTATGRESATALNVDYFFDQAAFGIDPFRAPTGGTAQTPFLGTSTSNDFTGTGETTRENTVTATIGARVVKVLPGGLLQVEGAREVRVNNETQIVVVRGLVRPRDIGPDNSVLSIHMADCQIEYYGKGVLADKRTPGWLARLLDNAWPF